MGIIQLNNQWTSNHKEFLSKAKDLIKEVKDLRTKLQQALETQERNLKKLTKECYTAHE